jgi:hypothetical protein
MQPLYLVLDDTSNPVYYADSELDAKNFREIAGRYDWRIVRYHLANNTSTQKQRNAVKFCERTLGVTFYGDINCKSDCSNFLTTYLEQAYEKQSLEKNFP